MTKHNNDTAFDLKTVVAAGGSLVANDGVRAQQMGFKLHAPALATEHSGDEVEAQSQQRNRAPPVEENPSQKRTPNVSERALQRIG